ncbi:MAG TPA: DUF4240 domain-containing protein, partial [Nitrospira sp.]|nr:DUF4240 domain-containing protein [Nitrospira sp.]
WGAAFVINGGCSDDGFEYFRGWLMLQGRDVWEAALRDPDSLAEVAIDGNADCEDVLSVATEAYRRVTGRSLPSHGEPQEDQPAGQAWEEEDLESLYPRLWERSAKRVRNRAGDDSDQLMGLGMSMLASGAFEPAARAFSSVRQHAPRTRTRAIATNNLAWTNLMIGTPATVREALPLANDALRMMSDELELERYMGSVRGTLAFALIENDQALAGIEVIEDVLAKESPGPNILALRLCVQAIGLARAGDSLRARALISRARKADPNCQLLTRARQAVMSQQIVVPEDLRGLAPLVQRFGISDDVERQRVLNSSSTEELIALVNAVTKEIFVQINQFLDLTFDAEDAVPFGDMAQAAMEARLELTQRGVSEA